MSSRRDFVRAILATGGSLVAGSVCALDWPFDPSRPASSPPQRMTDVRTRLAETVRHWDALGVHRTGTDVDTATAEWLAAVGRRLGFRASLDGFDLDRRTPTAAWLEHNARRHEGVPLFDGGVTGVAGIRGTLGAAEGRIAVLRVPPYEGLPGARALHAARRDGRHPAILAVTDDRVVLPGLAVLNAESFGTPFGPPVLQLPSHLWRALNAAAEAAEEVHVAVDFRIDQVTASNVRIDVPGRDPDLAPVVVITPRSGWWHSTSERGGGIAVWLDLLGWLAQHPPLRPVIFSANTGHELGHLGMRHFLSADPERVAAAHGWLHLGANFAASLHPGLRLQASDEVLFEFAEQALIRHRTPPELHTEPGEAPLGEARDIHAGNGRYVSILGTNGAFHHTGDRWPDSVDLRRLTDIAFACREILGAMVNA